MRLLDTSTLKLREFHDDEIPDYAILSHTWEEGEMSFEVLDKAASAPASDTSDTLHKEAIIGARVALESGCLPGYTKIARCCIQAASEGWDYVWIDTCCIDKTSSAELSEAINSMYRWYEEAQACYVYMTDVSSASQERFQWSRWFTRGWTLQELLAPSTVVFYDKDWLEIGTRWSLRAQISRATGMTYDSMIRPKDSSIATKMSWASNRKTTRVEDIAYCLMGLFEINMPLLYGEGHKAFMRLQYEIMQSRDDDESIFAWRDAGLSSSGMFARSPAAFADSGDIQCVGNEHPRAAPPVVTKTLLSLTGLVPTTDSREKSTLVTLNCVLAGSSNTYVAVEVKTGSSRYVRSSPGHLEEVSFLRGHEPRDKTKFNHRTLKMLLNHTEYASATNSSIKKQQSVVFQVDRVFRLTEMYAPLASFVPDRPITYRTGDVRKDEIASRNLPQHGQQEFRFKFHNDRSIAGFMFQVETKETFAVILTASEAAPSIDVVLASPPQTLTGVLEPYLENSKENQLDPLIGCEPGADQFFFPLKSQHRICVTFRKRILERNKIFCVDMRLEQDLNWRGRQKWELSDT
ncbi:MAG: hypothetical protein ALECFALPRED_009186 [Alectoria fallacina]|uniref:Heterokaryon incompatibility domain-containing protein n=1 Tax=Alectoria fallacina TaxID=1903189 RepID=A0A8H3J6V9_9LECA|nr:MAG: hypothetical protein ALECFALPRED_009186 [Alectoria fallacina]